MAFVVSLLLLVLELVGEPVEALVEAVSTGGTGGLDVPVAVAQRVQAQLVRYLSCIHGIWQVLKRSADKVSTHCAPESASADEVNH